MRFSRESSATRRIMMPAWVPGGYFRASEKSRSCVMRKRSSTVQACQILSSGSPARFSSKTLWTSCSQSAKTALQGKREILVEFDPHAAAVCKTGKSSRAEAAA
jgi:hypothetical protein